MHVPHARQPKWKVGAVAVQWTSLNPAIWSPVGAGLVQPGHRDPLHYSCYCRRLFPQVVTAWQGLGISAFARAAAVLQPLGSPAVEPKEALFPVEAVAPGSYLEAAERAATFVRTSLVDPASGELLR